MIVGFRGSGGDVLLAGDSQERPGGAHILNQARGKTSESLSCMESDSVTYQLRPWAELLKILPLSLNVLVCKLGTVPTSLGCCEEEMTQCL